MGCASGTVKYLLFFANVFFAFTGLALLIVGILNKINISKYSTAVPDDFKNLQLAPNLTIAVGSIIFIIAFLGCCGALRESTFMLTMFALLLIGIFIAQIAIGVYAFIKVSNNAGSFQTDVTNTMKKLVNAYEHDTNSKETMDLIQETWQCCGADGPSDYVSPPASCCNATIVGGGCVDVYSNGCAITFFEFLQTSVHIIGYVVIGTAAVEIINIIFALCLASSIRNEARRGRY